MATGIYSGREAQLKVAATSSGTATKFGALRDFTVTVDRSDIATSHQESSGWTIRLPGIATWGVTAGCVYLSTAATVNEQDTLRTALTGETRKWFDISNSTAAGSQTWKGYGYVTQFVFNGDPESPQLHTFAIAGDGKLTES
jgi:hypothetical protein